MLKIKANIPCDKVLDDQFDRQIDLNEITTRTIVTWPGGVEKRVTTLHKLADYFEAIEKNFDENFVYLTFHIKEELPKHHSSFWKDLIIRILRAHCGDNYFPLKMEHG